MSYSSDAFALMQQTWPAQEYFAHGPFVIGRSEGGGGRVNSAVFSGRADVAEVQAAVGFMQGLGLAPAFLATEPEQDLVFAEAGLSLGEEVLIMEGALPEGTNYGTAQWPPAPGGVEVWAEGGILAPRLAVMDHVKLPKTALSIEDRAVVFGAVVAGVLVVHALEVRKSARQQGLGGQLIAGISRWGREQGAERLMLVVTANNVPALALYDRAGLQVRGAYRYWHI